MPAQMVCTETDCTTGPPAVPDAGGDASPSSPDAGSPPPPTSACPVPVPGPVILPGPVWGEYQVHFYVPFPSYAFAAAHASFAMNALGAYALRETPSAFFATALKESYLGCSDKLPPYNPYVPGYLYTRTLSYASGYIWHISTHADVESICRHPDAYESVRV